MVLILRSSKDRYAQKDAALSLASGHQAKDIFLRDFRFPPRCQ